MKSMGNCAKVSMFSRSRNPQTFTFIFTDSRFLAAKLIKLIGLSVEKLICATFLCFTSTIQLIR